MTSRRNSESPFSSAEQQWIQRMMNATVVGPAALALRPAQQYFREEEKLEKSVVAKIFGAPVVILMLQLVVFFLLFFFLAILAKTAHGVLMIPLDTMILWGIGPLYGIFLVLILGGGILFVSRTAA